MERRTQPRTHGARYETRHTNCCTVQCPAGASSSSSAQSSCPTAAFTLNHSRHPSTSSREAEFPDIVHQIRQEFLYSDSSHVPDFLQHFSLVSLSLRSLSLSLNKTSGTGGPRVNRCTCPPEHKSPALAVSIMEEWKGQIAHWEKKLALRFPAPAWDGVLLRIGENSGATT